MGNSRRSLESRWLTVESLRAGRMISRMVWASSLVAFASCRTILTESGAAKNRRTPHERLN